MRVSALCAARVPAGLGDPTDRGWAEAPMETVTLSATPLGGQPSRYIRTSWATRPYGLVRSVGVRAAHDGECLYLRLEWSSPGRDGGDGHRELPGRLEGPDAFADAVAVMFPLDGDADMASMGSEAAPVTIWRWAAAVPDGTPEAVEDLTATGIGTLRRAERAPGAALLVGRSSGHAERRQVVFCRALEPGQAERRAFVPGASCPIAFAVWAGANQERAGIKSTSLQWSELSLER